jgi:hypothetical protein
MFPWLMIWAPQLHFPFSGSVAQQIDPNWFFGAISPSAGDAKIEQEAWQVASYGRQLGLITEVLIALAEQSALPGNAAKAKAAGAVEDESTEDLAALPVTPAQAAESLARLKAIRGRIEALKARERGDPLPDLEAQLAALL